MISSTTWKIQVLSGVTQMLSKNLHKYGYEALVLKCDKPIVS